MGSLGKRDFDSCFLQTLPQIVV
uniref:Uncharacterized protein n=1 Tax=Rhizophora mucronata TaxID=61149 RepID=A0A2P2P3M6_RHIMU